MSKRSMMKKTLAIAMFCVSGIALTALPSKAETKTGNPDNGVTQVRTGTPKTLTQEIELSQNAIVKSYIKAFLNQKERFGRMLGLSKYYFPIYEKVLKEHNMPDQLKYISVIESALNPHAVSTAGAAGPWQFLNEIGKRYGLAVNDSLDERRDPLLACNAAANYLQESYNMYGNDWLVAIASYNAGRNNIKWAMEDSGGKTNYWELRKYLPAETQSYVPAFIATVIIMNNPGRYGIEPIMGDFPVDTKTLQLKKSFSMENVAKAANISLDQLCALNPAYKKLTVYCTEKSPKRLVLPILPGFAYNAVYKELGFPLDPDLPMAPKVIKYYISYRVQQGDTFDVIAEKFKITPEEVKRLNKMNDTSVLTPGMMLQIGQG
ncbi:transglycosylase SLT domain-containing protein [Pedobacter sp. HMF7647]|uniref:Transglycosylase SLT domain-containing protein n=1 Tax=Hufsiella arboris TaxID=2695275 RepID=A0A7K1YFX3_9SPHI|nr:lytic transglycosylase domain-containing protein [Hufsiella arboris]MXV53038.1 transglycosylase SLT domain-containing protein [Hufsiella arboris]